jgi:hypothetical protein
MCRPVDCFVEIGERQPDVSVDDRQLVGVPQCGASKYVADRVPACCDNRTDRRSFETLISRHAAIVAVLDETILPRCV